MAKPKIIYLRDDDARVLDMCEACGLIENRSAWLRKLLNEFAIEHKVQVALKQRIKELKEELAMMEALDLEMATVEIDRDLLWSKLAKQFGARGETPRSKDLNWLRSRKRELAVLRPGKSVEEVLDELVNGRYEK